MPHDLAFADAARPSRVVCLRLLLKPYSIGHELLLWRARNPLLLATQQEFNELPVAEQIHSLFRAVSICSRDWFGNQKPEKWVRLWGWTVRNTDWLLAIADFRNYLASGRAMLPVLSASIPEDVEAYEISNNDEKLGGGGRALGAPFIPQLIIFLASVLRIEHDKLWDYPYALAANLYFTHLENEGRLNIENYKETEIKREMAGHKAAVLAEEKAAKDQDA